jgi:hypothetical protein
MIWVRVCSQAACIEQQLDEIYSNWTRGLVKPPPAHVAHTRTRWRRRVAARRKANQERGCSSTLGSESSRRNRGFAWAGRSNAATNEFHWFASNEKRRWSASVCSASAQALRDRGAPKVEGITSFPCTHIVRHSWRQTVRARAGSPFVNSGLPGRRYYGPGVNIRIGVRLEK